ncbi:MAG: regulator of protease activity HflC (stomatin/prohibitin superfamily) [bacterium]
MAKKITFSIIGGILLLSFFFSTYQVVNSGQVGVVTYFGAVQSEILPEGLHLIMPFRTKVIPINVRIQKYQASATASSKDLQNVTSKVVLNFFLAKDKANIIFQKLGAKYQFNIIQPAIQESVKSSTARYTAEELITKRPFVKNDIFKDLQIRLKKYHIIVTDFSIVNFSFSREFNRAIEEKQVAEQRALRAKNDLNRIRVEADQVRIEAEGRAKATIETAKAEAKSQKLLRETLTSNIIKLRMIQKWNGVLPQITSGSGGNLFFQIDSKTLKKK